MRTTKESASTQFIQYTDPGKNVCFTLCATCLPPFYILTTNSNVKSMPDHLH